MKSHLIFMASSLILSAVQPNVVASQSYGTELPFVLGADARTSGMGGAGTSLLGDVSLQFYNPSTLSYLEWKQFVFFRTKLFDSKSSYHAFGYGHPLLKYGTVGISIMRVDVGGIEERDDTNQLLSDDLHNSQTRVLLGYAKDITSSLAAGFNLKLDNQSFAGYSGSGIGLDVGLSASQNISHRFLKGLRQGLVIQNLIEPSIKLDQEKVPDPRSLALGVAVISDVGNVLMVTAIDLVYPRFSPVALRVGHEVVYQNRYSLRIGLDRTTLTYGLGAKYTDLSLDYSYRSEDLGGNHRISLSVHFGPSLTASKSRAPLELENEVNDPLNHRMAEKQSQITALERGDRCCVCQKAFKGERRARVLHHDAEYAAHTYCLDRSNPSSKCYVCLWRVRDPDRLRLDIWTPKGVQVFYSHKECYHALFDKWRKGELDGATGASSSQGCWRECTICGKPSE